MIPNIPMNLPGNRHPGVTELYLESGQNNFVNVSPYSDSPNQQVRPSSVLEQCIHPSPVEFRCTRQQYLRHPKPLWAVPDVATTW
jgi:hypothetical protein